MTSVNPPTIKLFNGVDYNSKFFLSQSGYINFQFLDTNYLKKVGTAISNALTTFNKDTNFKGKIITSSNVQIGGATALTDSLMISSGNIGINSRSDSFGIAKLTFYQNPWVDGTQFPTYTAGKTAIIAQAITDWSKSKLHFCLNNTSDGTTSVSLSDAKMTIIPSGNVGIGTTTPSEIFTVQGGSYPSILLKDTTNTSDYISIMRDHSSNKNIIRNSGRLDIESPANYQRMTFLSNGNVGVGTTAPSTLLDINGTTTVRGNILSSGVGTLDIGSSGNPFNNIYSSKIVDCQAVRSGASSIPFMQNNNVSSLSGQNVLWQHTTNESTPTNFQLLIETKGTTTAYERMQISSYRNSGYRNIHFQPSGRVMIGGDYTSTAPTDTLDVGGGMTVRGTINTDGVGTRDIGNSTNFFGTIYANNINVSNLVSNCKTWNLTPAANNTYVIGNTSSSQYNAIYGNTIYGNGVVLTSDINKKKDIQDIDDGLGLVMKLKPKSFKFIEGVGNSNRIHTGFIAQEVKNLFCDNWAVYVDNNAGDIGLRYDELIAFNTRSIQQLYDIIQEQKNTINDLKNQIEELKQTPPIPVLHRCVEVSLINNLLERVQLLENNFSTTNING